MFRQAFSLQVVLLTQVLCRAFNYIAPADTASWLAAPCRRILPLLRPRPQSGPEDF